MPLLRPPIAARRPHRTVVHGIERVDPYHWLRERDDPAVRAYLEAENAYTEAVLAPLAEMRETLYRELLGRIVEDDVSPTYRDGEWLYYSRSVRGGDYPIVCRKHGSPEAPEQVLLDVNALAAGHDYFDLGACETSPDHRLLAYSFDTEGDESYTLVVRDLETGALLPDRLEGLSDAVAWASDSRTLLAVELDAVRRPWRVLHHRLGEAGPAEVWREEDERFFVDVDRSRSGDWLFVETGSAVTSETRLVPAADPTAAPRLVAAREQEVEYAVDHRGDELWILTNREAENFRLMRCPVGETDPAGWAEAIAHRERVKLDAFDLFRDFVVLVEREDGLRRLRILRPDSGDDHVVELPEEVHALSLDENLEADTETYRFGYSSPVTPHTWYDYRPAQRSLEVVKRQEIPSGHDPSLYAARRTWATSPDGVRVPITVACRKDVGPDAGAPCLLYGYGAYGISIDASFSPHTLSLLERGFVHAVAHVRGGGELGEAWHKAGKLERKESTFADFIAAAERLVEEGWTAPERLAIRGGSAGGLLVGTVLNRRPELFAAALALVPFVDVANTMLDASLPLTVTEYEEWGDPADPEVYRRLLAYSPYENVGAGPYPPLLVTAGWNDPRVQYWEPAKWVAKLRSMTGAERGVLLKTDMGSGHGGPSGRYEALRERALELTFLFDRLGVR
jgi:oligopeptidase B